MTDEQKERVLALMATGIPPRLAVETVITADKLVASGRLFRTADGRYYSKQ